MKWLELIFGVRRPLGEAQPGAARPALAQALEPRMLFDGAVAATTADTLGTDATADQSAGDGSATPGADAAAAADAPADSARSVETAASGELARASGNREEVVFVDGQVQDYQQLIDALPAGTEVVVLDASRNGLEQIADYLQGRSGIDAIYLLSHGESGAFKAGETWIDGESLAAQRDTLARIGAALATDGDILLYGCKTGEGEAGATLVEELARLTQADVAASDDNTGAAQLGGDWVLERSSGSVEASALAVLGYDSLLAAPTTLNFDSVTVDGSGYSLGGSPRVFDGWTITLNTSAGSNAPESGATPSYLDVSGNVADTWLNDGGVDKALLVKGYYNVAASARFVATTGEEFSLQSLRIENLGMSSGNLQVLGYRNGVLVASQNFTATSGSALQVTLDSASDADWKNIDEFRIVQQNGSADILFAIDDISVATAVLPNVAPVIGNLAGDSANFTEGGSAVLLDAGGNATLTDSDSGNFAGGNVTVAITGNRVAGEDLLSVRNQGSGAGQIGVSGSTVSYGGVAIGTVSGGSGSSDLVISLNSSATPAAVQALLRNLTYSNANNNAPSTATRTLSITVNDGDGGTSSVASVTVGVTATNDAPTLTASGGTPTYTENGSAVDLFSGVTLSTVEGGQTVTRLTLTVDNLSDGGSEILRIDGSDVALTNGNSLTTAGNGMTVTVSLVGAKATVTVDKAGGIGSAAAQSLVDGLSYRNASEAPAATSRVVTLTGLTDSGGTASGGVDTTSLALAATVTVVAVNDAPVANADSLAASEDTPVTYSSAALLGNDTDAEGNSLSIAAVSSGVGGSVVLSGGSVIFTPDANFNGLASFSYTLSDGSATSAATTVTVNVAAVNDAPTLGASGGTPTYTENGSAVDLFSGVTLSTVESGQTITQLTLSVDNLADGGDEILHIDGSDVALTDGNTVTTASNGMTVTVSLVGATASVVIGKAGGISTVAAQTLVDELSYRNASEAPSTAASRVVTLSGLTDNGGSASGGVDTASLTLAATVTVASSNDAPQLSSGTHTLAGTNENSSSAATSVATLLAGLGASDADAGAQAGIAVTASSGSGTWQYSTDGITWNAIGTVSAGSALLLSASTQLRYVPDAQNGETATLTFRAWDQTSGTASSNGTRQLADTGSNGGSTAFSSALGSASLAVSAVNDAPVISLPGSLAVSEDVSTALSGIAFSDVDAGSGTLTVTFGVDSGTLSASSGGGVTVAGSGTAALTLSGTLSDLNTFIGGGAVHFQTAANATADVTLSVGIADGGNSGSGGALNASATTTLQVTAVNDRPLLGDASAEVIASGESAAASIGPVSVATLVSAGAISDVDGPQVGVVIVATSGAGTWQYSTDGSSWNAMGALSTSQALVLDGNAYVRYVPAGGAAESATLTLGGWDGSAGSNAQKLDTAASPDAFSAGTFTASITVSETNVAPLLTPASPLLAGITENATGNAGQTVASILGSSVSDSNSGALQGIAITGLDAGNGTWQYSLDGGASWSDVGSVSTGSALLLRASDRVRFVPDGANGTTATFSYRAWDQSGASAGQQGSKVDASVAGGSTAFSVAGDTARLTATSVNDAPTLTTTAVGLAASDEDAISPAFTVADLLASAGYGDVDSGALAGIAITGWTGNGSWQYSTDGSTWYALPSASDSTALLLDAGASLRYGGDGRNGETATLAFRAWDQSQGSATSGATTVFADTGSNGGTAAFSATTATASLPVNAINDAPTVSAASIGLAGTNEDTPTVSVSVAQVLADANWADADSGALGGIAITSVTANGNWQYSSDGGTSWVDFGSVSASAALLLDSATLLRYQPDGIDGETPSLAFKAWDQTSGTASTNAVRSTGDTTAGSAWSSVTVPFSTTVTAIADAPLVATSGGTTAFIEADGGGSAPVAVDPGLTLSDLDSTSLASAAVRITGNFQPGQDLLAFANDGSSMGDIVASYDAGTGVLTLTSSGATATLAQWQAALCAVSYGNSSDAPSTATRSIAFVVNDGAVDSSAASKSLSVASSNDTPSLNVPLSIGVTEDVASALTGISFADADAGSASVTATLSVASGSLAGTSGGGVTVGGSGSATLTLTGSLANLNAFIAAGQVEFTTASNASAEVVLSVSLDDGGNTGSGGAKSASATSVLHVAAINDAPLISAPGSIGVSEDVATALTGISFSDVDAAGASVSVTLSVASGSLAATSGGGVSVGGSGSGSLTLAGSIVDINAFIAASGVAFTTASNATGNVTLAVSIDDGGNSGSDPASSGTAGSEAASTTLTLSVTAVNDAPLNAVPASASVDQDVVLVFSSGNGNAISIGDVDAGSGNVRVTLTASNGLLTLAGTSGLSFVSGDGMADASMTFEGSLASVNLALNGLTFTPAPGYNGPASLQIVSNDRGLSGSGGAQSDSDSVAITVNSVSPLVTSVSATSPDGGYKAGDTLLVTVSFDQIVTVDSSGGAPTLLLETGSVDRSATYVSGSGTSTLTFAYTVQAGDTSADLGYVSTAALALNGASIRNVTSDDAILTLPAVGGADSLSGQRAIVVDGIVPLVTSVSVPADGTYVAGQNLDFTVNLSEAVIADSSGGTPRLAVTLDDGSIAYANYLSGSGSASLVFRLTVASGQLDGDGIVLAGSLDLNGGTLRDAFGNAAQTTLNGVAATGGVRIDAVVPGVGGVAVPADGDYNAGDVLTFSVQTSEAVLVDSSGGTPRLALDIGGVTRYASYVSGAGTGTLVFQYSVQVGDSDADGIAVGGLDANGGRLCDAAGNDLAPTLNGVASTAGVRVDTTAPTVSAIARLDANPSNAGSVSYWVSFDEAVSGVDTGDFVLATSGTASGSIASVTRIDARTYTVVVDGLAGTGSLGLDLKASGTGIADAAGNPLAGGLVGESYSLDRDAPRVTGVSAPADGTYVAGQHLDFTVSLSEAVLVDSSGGTPRLAVTLADGSTAYAEYVSGSGSTALVFRLTVASGQLDGDGVVLAGNLDLNGGTLRDALGNPAQTALDGVAATDGVRIDAVVPGVTGVAVPAAGDYNAGDVLTFTVQASEAVLVDSSGGRPRLALDIGGVTRYATYVSGSGSTALVFQYSVQAGDNGSGGIVVDSLQLNGGSLRDSAGNDLPATLNGVAGTTDVQVDTSAPALGAIVRLDASPTNAGSVSYLVSFDEAVSGVDAGDFAVVTTGTASGVVRSVVQLDAQTYRVTLDGLRGEGTLGLELAAAGSEIRDRAGNPLVEGGSGERYELRNASGNPESRAHPPRIVVNADTSLPRPLSPMASPAPTASPLLLPSLFATSGPGSGIPSLGALFRSGGGQLSSVIAQVFARPSTGGEGAGRVNAGAFATSSLADIFAGHESRQEQPPAEWGSEFGCMDTGAGPLCGAMGAPTLGQQLEQMHESELRQRRELARALEQVGMQLPQA